MANAIWQATIVDQSGNVLPGAEVAVVNEATGLSAPLFTTRTGTAKSNPFFADANGFAQFYAAPGLYRITATSAGTGTTMTWRNVRLVDVATKAEAIAGTAGVLPDAAEVHAAFKQYGLGAEALANLIKAGSVGSGFFGVNSATDNSPIGGDGVAITGTWARFGAGAGEQILYISRYAPVRGWLQTKPTATAAYSTVELIHSGNTTVDGNGFIKDASPIIKLHIDSIEKNGDFSADFEKIGTGHYVIKNTLGFARQGWYIETPKDANGNIKIFVEYEDNDGDITIKTYEPDYSTGRVTAGAPADIPEGRWIDIRLHELPPEPEPAE